MPSLVPNPSDRTNALLVLLVTRADNSTLTSADLNPPFSATQSSIVANCFLYGSLCCSLIAAVGAMLGKEWLQSYRRSGQSGPAEEQAQRRQTKHNGAQDWHMEAVILLLPNLLLASVLLFFVGLILFLIRINMAVSAVVISFSGFGVLAASITIIAGAASHLCPYQTAVSRGLRRTVKALAFYSKRVAAPIKRFAVATGKACIRAVSSGARLCRRGINVLELHFPLINNLLKTISRQRSDSTIAAAPLDPQPSPARKGQNNFLHIWWDSQKTIISSTLRRIELFTNNIMMDYKILRDHPGDMLNAQAACWFLSTTSRFEDQLQIIQNICCLHPKVCGIFLQDPFVWRRLKSLFRDAIGKLAKEPTAENVEIVEKLGASMYHIVLRYPSDHPQREEIDSLVTDSLETGPSEIPENVSCLLKFLFSSSRQQPDPRSVKNYFVRKAFLHRMLLLDAESGVQCAVASEVQAQYDDAILSLGNLMLSNCYDNNAGDDETRSLTELAMEAYMGQNVLTDADDTVMRRIAALTPDEQTVVPSRQQTKSASE
ncbi:hypothetical protein FRC00_010951, partial [Tulasnella sp. 408]